MLYKILLILVWPFFKIIFRFEHINRPNNLENEKLIICANHISALDPILLALTYNRPIHFLAKKELFENKLLNRILLKLGAIPIDRDVADLRAMKASFKVLKDKEVLGIFPEGTRVKEISEENMKTGIGYIAHRSQSNIQPVEIIGNYKPFRKIKIIYKDIIEIEKYNTLDKKEAYNQITQDTYRSIYE